MNGVVRFGNKGMFSPRYLGPNENVQRIGKVAYELMFPSYWLLSSGILCFHALDVYQ